MTQKNRIADLVDAATAGLKDDAELRLDVRAELLSHIQDKAESLRAEGKSEEESVELACRSFGRATDIAGALVEANRRRMKLRAVARLAIRAALVPVAVAVALLVCGSLILRMRKSVEAEDAQFEYGTYVPPGIPDESVFLFTGDLSRASKAERQRAIWEQHPESKVYYGNYMSHLADQFKRFVLRDLEPADAEFSHFEEELHRAEKLDPENARYDYLLAGALFAKGCKLKHEYRRAEDGEWVPGVGLVLKGRGIFEGKAKPGKDSHRVSLVVRDRRLLDRAMAEVLQGASKPHLKAYAREMVKERLSVVPPAHSLEDKYGRISVVSDIRAPDSGYHQNLARVVPLCAELLIAEGRPAEAKRLLDTWYPFVRQMVGEANWLFELLFAPAILGLVEMRYASAYEKLGSHEEAERTRRWARRLYEPVTKYHEERKLARESHRTGTWFLPPRVVEESGSVLARTTLYSVSGGEDYLAPGRRTEHVLLETAALSYVLAVLIVLMLGALIVMLRWRFARGMSSVPLLLLPSWEETARILGLGVLLPLAAFYLYTRWSGLAGREYAINYLVGRFVLELCLLMATIAFLAIAMATGYVRERCRTLGIAVPEGPGERRWLPHWITLGVLWLACLALRHKLPALLALIAVGVPAMVFVLSYAVIIMVRRLRSPRDEGLFRGTVARSLIPVFAAAAILIGGVAHPYLTNLEAALVRRDPILTLDEELPVNKPEADLVRKLKAEIREAIDEIEAEKKGASPPEARAERTGNEARTE